jgi:hypothetical protein
MTSKARQLFLELYLLRLRYTDAEIELVSNVSEVMNDRDLNNILLALQKLQVSAPSEMRRNKPVKGSSRLLTGRSSHDRGGVQKAIIYFVDRLTRKKIFPTQEQLDGFARSIAINETSNDRQEVARAIRQTLESMPPTLALQLMRDADGQSKSDSNPYLNLAKTLMRT